MTNEEKLLDILLHSKAVHTLLETLPHFDLPNGYLAAGCVVQTVWNDLYGFAPTHGIDDADIVYFDAADLTKESEQRYEGHIASALPVLPFRVDVKNEARVHLWYREKFGYDIAPYASTEDAIDSFPTTATAIGVRPSADSFIVYAPYGVDDLLNGIVRPNKKQITEAIYMKKATKWLANWPDLTIISWDA